MFNQIRYRQQLRQIQAVNNQGISHVATYGDRNLITGQRSIQTADGGIANAQYLSNSTPNQVLALSQSSTIGLAGYISQKPY